MKHTKTIAGALAVLGTGLALAAAGASGEAGGAAAVAVAGQPSQNEGLPQGSEPVDLDPADFTTRIDNRFWPMKPGNKWVYRETDSKGTNEKVVVKVTARRS